MDLIAACRVFVHVGERGSVTLGAEAARVPQPVASRRIAALERHFGELLLDRSARRVTLTAFGRAVLPSARRLVELAEAMELDAEQARLLPVTVAVPGTCSVRHLAGLAAAARACGRPLEFRPAGPATRTELLRGPEVGAALVAVPAAGADWTVPLGVASADGTPGGGASRSGPFRFDMLRSGRTRAARRLWLQPEDDVPHVRDRLVRLGHRAALLPAQIALARSPTAAVGAVLGEGDLVVCSARQAREWGLAWRRISGDPVARGYAAEEPAGAAGGGGARLKGELRAQVALALGAEDSAKDAAEDAAETGTARPAPPPRRRLSTGGIGG